MKHRTRPDRSNGPPFSSLAAFSDATKIAGAPPPRPTSPIGSCGGSRDFSSLPHDLVARIAASFARGDVESASLVCRSWSGALRPMREAMRLLRRGKRLRRGGSGALEAFLGGAARGSSLAMVDAGLVYWGRGEREEAVALYRRAAALGDASGQYNLGISCLQAEPPNRKEARRWLYLASMAGHTRAQYQLALSLHQDCGADCNLPEAARWYMKAAEGGHVGGMYNLSRFYSCGKGLVQNHRQARKWMKRAADRGHSKAQFDYGFALFSKGDMIKAVVYLELAACAGITAANHVKTVILQQLSTPSCDRVMPIAGNWRALASR